MERRVKFRGRETRTTTRNETIRGKKAKRRNGMKNARGQVAPVPVAIRFAFTNKQRPRNMVPIFNKLYLITVKKT